MCGKLSHLIDGLENSLSRIALFVVEIMTGCSRTPRSWHARFYLTESTSKTAEQRSRDSLSGDRIPDALDVLVTHGPPYGILDQTASDGPHLGCEELLKAVRQKPPKVHVF